MKQLPSAIEKIEKTGLTIRLALLLLALIPVAGCKTSNGSHPECDIYFRPCATDASVSFEGLTQEGKQIHKLEVRRLAYFNRKAKKADITMNSCVIYYAGEIYGPSILLQIWDCVDPFARKVSDDVVEIYYSTGAHGHVRQKWKLLGAKAKLESEEAINWDQDPRITDAEKAKYR